MATRRAEPAAPHISDMRGAIADGTVPGAFSADRTEFAFPPLTYAGTRGATHRWAIRVRLIDEAAGEYVPIADAMLAQPAPPLAGRKAEITVETSQVGGKQRDVVPTYVSAGKNLGKKNATNAVTQAIRDALGLYNKQRKRADLVEAPAEAEAPAALAPTNAAPGAAPTNAAPGTAPADAARLAALGLGASFDATPLPMLVKKLGDSRAATLTAADFADGVTVQRKFNGVHFIVYARPEGGEPVCYSRMGTIFPGQAQIVGELGPMFAAAPPIAPGAYGLPAVAATDRDRIVEAAYAGNPAPYLAGELYLHGKSLNWISGQARRGDDEGLLELHVFDVFFPYAKAVGHDMESRHRQAYLDAFFAAASAAGLEHRHVVRVENFRAASAAEMEALSRRFLDEGYEGAIARKDRAGYQYGYSNYHSPNLVKVKPRHDAEFPVIGYMQGTRGKDVGALIWVCEVPNPTDPRDRTFTVVPNMGYQGRYALFRCLGQEVEGPDGTRMTRFERDVKGLPLTVEYAEISPKTGKPLQPKAIAFRTYEAGPGKDPWRELLRDCGLAK